MNVIKLMPGIAGIFLFSILIISGLEFSSSFLIGVLAALSVPSISRYLKYRKIKEAESHLPDFLLDVVANINSGMSVTNAVKSVSDRNYGRLSPYIKKMAAQMDWGVPFPKILKQFSDSLDSKTVKITMNTILEANKSGGNITNVLKATAMGVSEIEKLKKERNSRIYSHLVNGYIIFFTFVAVMIVLQRTVFPSLFSAQGSLGGFAGLGFYSTIFRNLIIIQGLFSGIAIGKMAEGSASAGFRHSVILVALGFVAFTLFG